MSNERAVFALSRRQVYVAVVEVTRERLLELVPWLDPAGCSDEEIEDVLSRRADVVAREVFGAAAEHLFERVEEPGDDIEYGVEVVKP